MNPIDRVTVAIPTRDRPEYLSILLSSLIPQAKYISEIIILSNGPTENQTEVPIVTRFTDTLKAMDLSVRSIYLGEIGRSAATAYNRAMLECQSQVLLCLDDDTWVEPNCLGWLIESFNFLETQGSEPVVLSPVSPWMDRAWEGIGPEVINYSFDEDTRMVELIPHHEPLDGNAHETFSRLVRFNSQFDVDSSQPQIHPSDAISPLAFMLRPNLGAPWSDVGHPCTFSDLAWSIQLQLFHGYKLFFDIRCDVWHVNASHGGLRKSEGDYSKRSEGYLAQLRRVGSLLSSLKLRKEQS